MVTNIIGLPIWFYGDTIGLVGPTVKSHGYRDDFISASFEQTDFL
jgi:hypothetical protein